MQSEPQLLAKDVDSGTTSGKQSRRTLTIAIMAALSSPAYANETSTETAATLDPITVQFRGERVDSPKYTRDLLDTPRIITVLSSDLLEEQNVTSMRDAFRNVTGISLQAGEGNPPAGDQLKIRGFNARDDLNVNGVRDLGNYFRDPFYVDQIEVIKGPNSTYGGRGSAGGSVNFVTKKPMQVDRNRLELSAGTEKFRRATIDVNKTIDDNSAVRINMLTHKSDFPGRDVAEEKRHGFYGAYTWGFQRDTQVTVDYLHIRQDNLPDAGLPMDRERPGNTGTGSARLPSGINFKNFYGHTDDYQKIDVDQAGLVIDHTFNERVSIRNQTRYSAVDNDSLTSSPRIRNVQAPFDSLEGAQARGDLKPRDQEDRALFNQTDLLVSFDTGNIGHDLVVGFEMGRVNQENRRRPDISGPLTDLYNPERRVRPVAPYDGTKYRFQTSEFGAYLIDTMSFNPQWELTAGLRYDRVRAKASERGRADNISLSRRDSQVSSNLGLVFKPVPNASLYAAFGTAYEVSGTFDRNQVQLAGGANARVADPDTFNIAPEKTKAYEIGAKWDALDGLSLNAALFRTDKTNARTPALGDGDANEVLDGKQRVEGFEFIAAGDLTDAWRLYGSYTYMRSEVRKSNNAFEEGQRLGGTPRHTFSLFSTYDLTPKFSLGAGMLHISKQVSSVQSSATAGRLSVSIPSYTVYDAYASYRLTDQVQLRLNALNLFDKKYISQLAEGGAQGIPGAGRQIIGTIRYDF